ncbi:MAG TPA: glycosyltransferase family 1 protein [Opitutaceae bacterium]|nr:glycosyltransferase family 1 protein [Opitutaceae bacterium]
MPNRSPAPPRVLLVGPNPFEPRKSMWLFVECLAAGLPSVGFAPRIFQPRFPRLGRIGESRAAKVALRLVLEAAQLRRAARDADLVHVGDHASAFHLLGGSLARKPKVVTCHDVFFIASTLVAGAAAPRRERWWQERILRGIARSERVACVSRPTHDALKSLLADTALPAARTSIIPICLFQTFAEQNAAGVAARLAALDPKLKPGGYVLHVGGNFARKNREGVVRAFAALGPERGLRLVLGGEPPDSALRRMIAHCGVEGLTTIVADASAETLGILYQGAFALLFPSRAEGFGLPPIEAQTLGCPVVCSDIPTHRENLADTALFAEADDSAALASRLGTLADPAVRRQFAERGRANARRFSREAMFASYARLYRELLPG